MISICSIIKDEQRNLEEWIRWHLGIGFTNIFLFEDFGSTSHKTITDKFPAVHLTTCDDYFTIKREYDTGTCRQLRLYQKFLNEHKGEGWCAFIDLDEFVMLDEGETMADLLHDYERYNGLALYWQMYNANGHIARPEGGTVKNYTEKCGFLPEDSDDTHSWIFKTLVNLNKGVRFNNQHEIEGTVDVDGRGVTVWNPHEPNYRRLRLNHYYTRSYEDWLARFQSRGDLCQAHRKWDGFWSLNQSLAHLRKYIDDKGLRPYAAYYTHLGGDNYALDISKCASTTLHSVSARLVGREPSDGGVFSWHGLAPRFTKESVAGKRKIAVWRDPVERAVSFYSSNVLKYEPHIFGIEKFSDVVAEAERQYANPFGTSLLVDQHLRKQSDYYKVEDVDVIVRIEDLDEYLFSIGVEAPERLNVSEARYQPTEAEANAVRAFYADDYELLNSGKVWKRQ